MLIFPTGINMWGWEVEGCINLEISIIKCDQHLKELLLQMLTRHTISAVMTASSLHTEISRQIRKTLSNPSNGFTSFCFALSFVVKFFFSGMLSISVNLLQHLIFFIRKKIIYVTNRKKKLPDAFRRLSCAIL